MPWTKDFKGVSDATIRAQLDHALQEIGRHTPDIVACKAELAAREKERAEIERVRLAEAEAKKIQDDGYVKAWYALFVAVAGERCPDGPYHITEARGLTKQECHENAVELRITSDWRVWDIRLVPYGE